MKIQTLIFALALSLFCQHSFAQVDDLEAGLDAEIESSDGLPEQSEFYEESDEQIVEEAPDEETLQAEEEMKRQEEFARAKRLQEQENVSAADNRYPKPEPIFKKPPGPKQGGVVKVPHPRAQQGLVRIESDGTYHYKVASRPKSQSAAVKFAAMTAPEIYSDSGLTYDSMYGEDSLMGVVFEYEWKPFKTAAKNFGVLLGSGISFAQGNGSFKNARGDGITETREKYNLYVVPVSLFLNYRFEYMRRQLFVPFINGGATYFGLIEARDDGKSPTVAGAPAIGGGGGIHISISRLDSKGAFTLGEEYGISDMWLTVEARVMQGLYEDVDFTSQSINVGVTVDY